METTIAMDNALTPNLLGFASSEGFAKVWRRTANNAVAKSAMVKAPSYGAGLFV